MIDNSFFRLQNEDFFLLFWSTGTDVKCFKFKYKWKVGLYPYKNTKSSTIFTISQGMIMDQSNLTVMFTGVHVVLTEIYFKSYAYRHL